MNKQIETEKDSLLGYISHEQVEKAPEGFTERLMQIIQTEKKPAFVRSNSRKDYIVPLIFASFTIFLVILALVLPSAGNDYLAKPMHTITGNIPMIFSKINFDNLNFFYLPGWIFYIMTAIFFLSVLDRALNSFFHRKGR
jgi:ABC-type uncharacterized transport system fused permease/ATPase subunit